eukprot:TRINITY_DN67290_c7_g1_i2.p1 TRINITY_DN67290_c7_g1~~TRINITY_DN67290_c7_g1_i2.p1  ORF type:complete len:941 (-),score=107.05 TRINITY_DN67290_c7_g1_i2:120-2891(-)
MFQGGQLGREGLFEKPFFRDFFNNFDNQWKGMHGAQSSLFNGTGLSGAHDDLLGRTRDPFGGPSSARSRNSLFDAPPGHGSSAGPWSEVERDPAGFMKGLMNTMNSPYSAERTTSPQRGFGGLGGSSGAHTRSSSQPASGIRRRPYSPHTPYEDLPPSARAHTPQPPYPGYGGYSSPALPDRPDFGLPPHPAYDLRRDPLGADFRTELRQELRSDLPRSPSAGAAGWRESLHRQAAATPPMTMNVNAPPEPHQPSPPRNSWHSARRGSAPSTPNLNHRLQHDAEFEPISRAPREPVGYRSEPTQPMPTATRRSQTPTQCSSSAARNNSIYYQPLVRSRSASASSPSAARAATGRQTPTPIVDQPKEGGSIYCHPHSLMTIVKVPLDPNGAPQHPGSGSRPQTPVSAPPSMAAQAQVQAQQPPQPPTHPPTPKPTAPDDDYIPPSRSALRSTSPPLAPNLVSDSSSYAHPHSPATVATRVPIKPAAPGSGSRPQTPTSHHSRSQTPSELELVTTLPPEAYSQPITRRRSLSQASNESGSASREQPITSMYSHPHNLPLGFKEPPPEVQEQMRMEREQQLLKQQALQQQQQQEQLQLQQQQQQQQELQMQQQQALQQQRRETATNSPPPIYDIHSPQDSRQISMSPSAAIHQQQLDEHMRQLHSQSKGATTVAAPSSPPPPPQNTGSCRPASPLGGVRSSTPPSRDAASTVRVNPNGSTEVLMTTGGGFYGDPGTPSPQAHVSGTPLRPHQPRSHNHPLSPLQIPSPGTPLSPPEYSARSSGSSSSYTTGTTPSSGYSTTDGEWTPRVMPLSRDLERDSEIYSPGWSGGGSTGIGGSHRSHYGGGLSDPGSTAPAPVRTSSPPPQRRHPAVAEAPSLTGPLHQHSPGMPPLESDHVDYGQLHSSPRTTNPGRVPGGYQQQWYPDP